MSDVAWAIPGLMPPEPGNAISSLQAPEDGSLMLLLWVGTEADTVNYSLTVPGWHGGVIKDPNYDFGKLPPDKRGVVNSWPDYLYTENGLWRGVLVPTKRDACGYYVLLDEWCKERNPDCDRYFVLQLPKGSLPAGPTEVEAIVNGKVERHIVNRPYSAIHGRNDVTPRTYRYLQMKKNTTFAVKALEGAQRAMDICTLRHPELPRQAGTEAFVSVAGQVYPMGSGLSNGALLLDIPALPIGRWGYTVSYEAPNGVKRVLVQGIIESGDPQLQNSITYDNEGRVDFCYLADKEDLSSLLNGAKFAPSVWIFAPKAKIGTEAFSYATCTSVAGAMDRLESGVGMFRVSDITDIPAVFPALTDARSMFAGSKLKNGPEMPAATNMSGTFSGCTALDTVAAEYPEAVVADNVCNACDNLRYPCDLPKAASCKYSFVHCTLLQRIAYTPVAEALTGCYKGCLLLAEVADDTSWPALQDAEDAFAGCLSLTADNVTNIFNALPDRAGESHIITLPDTTAARGVDTSAAEAKGWHVEYK